jgi:hypothetical protein
MDRSGLTGITVVMVLLSMTIAGCTTFSEPGGKFGDGCHYEETAVSWSGSLTYRIAGDDLGHETNLTSTNFGVSLRVGNIVRDGNLKLTSTVPDNTTGGKKLSYQIIYKTPNRADAREKLVIPDGGTVNLTIRIYIEGTKDPFILSKNFFDGTNNITGKVQMRGDGDNLTVTLDKPYPGVKIVNTGDGSGREIQVRTTEWTFDVDLSNEILCVG